MFKDTYYERQILNETYTSIYEYIDQKSLEQPAKLNTISSIYSQTYDRFKLNR